MRKLPGTTVSEPCERRSTITFISFPKIPRFENESIIITEKIDGTNAQIYIDIDGNIQSGSRNRWVTCESDNYGFASYVETIKYFFEGIRDFRIYGEWWGHGIQRGYGLTEKRFSPFYLPRGMEEKLPFTSVPILYHGEFKMNILDKIIQDLKENGSKAAPGFSRPEGVVIYAEQSKALWKIPFDK